MCAHAAAPLTSGANDDVDMTVDDIIDTGLQSQQQEQAQAAQFRSRSRWEAEEDNQHKHQPADGHRQQSGSMEQGAARAVVRGESNNSETVGQKPGDIPSNSRPAKKAKFFGQLDSSNNGLDIDHEALLAGVNQVLEQLDADGAAGDGLRDLSNSDDAGEASRGAGLTTASSMSVVASYSSAGTMGGILKGSSTPGSVKKKVKWPDLPMEEEQHISGFRIAPIPRQVRPLQLSVGCRTAAAPVLAQAACVASGMMHNGAELCEQGQGPFRTNSTLWSLCSDRGHADSQQLVHGHCN